MILVHWLCHWNEQLSEPPSAVAEELHPRDDTEAHDTPNESNMQRMTVSIRE